MGWTRVVSAGALGCVLWGAAGCGADVATRARSTAARDLSCAVDGVRVVDEELGVVRLQGCGVEASYMCSEDHSTLRLRCEQLAAHKLEGPTGSKPEAGSRLAKD